NFTTFKNFSEFYEFGKFRLFSCISHIEVILQRSAQVQIGSGEVDQFGTSYCSPDSVGMRARYKALFTDQFTSFWRLNCIILQQDLQLSTISSNFSLSLMQNQQYQTCWEYLME
uniref:Uncharacterized protein n=1 Tax=Romanomermis culicivorax TaxID=13658 RepID=A0A915L407_ROMCU